jgi:hypothetical protein
MTGKPLNGKIRYEVVGITSQDVFLKVKIRWKVHIEKNGSFRAG